MSSSYQGVGYPGDDNYTLQGPGQIQQYLQTVGSLGPSLIAVMQAEEQRITGTTANNFTTSFFTSQGIPRTLPNLVTSFRNYLYTQVGGTVPPSEQAYNTGTFYSTLVSDFAAQINEGNVDFNAAALTGVLPSAFAGSTVYDDLYLLAFNNFAKNFVNVPSNPASAADQYNAAWESYSQRVVQVSLTLDPADGVNYVQILQGFTGLSSISDSIFANFVLKMIDDKGYFTPSGSFNEWVNQAVQLYVQSYTNSPSTVVSSVGASSGKTLILNRIFALLVDMVESLQKVTSAQSDRLTIFSQWQTAYGAMQNQVHYITKDDPNATLGDDDTRRSEYNSYNATLIETIKARTSAVSDDAKNIQTQISQSNDTVNQQVSMATSFLQELATILASLYR